VACLLYQIVKEKTGRSFEFDADQIEVFGESNITLMLHGDATQQGNTKMLDAEKNTA